MSVTNETISSLDNRLGLTPVSITNEVMNGLETSQTESVEKSLSISLDLVKKGNTILLPIPISFGASLRAEIKSTLNSFKQKSWKQTHTRAEQLGAS